MSRSAGRLGWLLVWALVFSDFGSAVYYAPGIASGAFGKGASLLIVGTVLVFALLCIKMMEVMRRFSGGGGVVSVAERAFGPWFGAAGGMLVLADFFLTVAMTAGCAVIYLDGLFHLGPLRVPLALAGLAALGAVNIIGVKQSALVAAWFAGLALVVDVIVILTAVLHAPGSAVDGVRAAAAALGPREAFVGLGGAWLAFSGLEAVAQLAPAMRDLNETPRRSLAAAGFTALALVPPLAILSIALAPASLEPIQTARLFAVLGNTLGGPLLAVAVVLTATALLLVAANTAVLGSYHVQVALTRRALLPSALGSLSRRFQTPYRAIVLATVVPAFILVATEGDIARIGALYGFGLLGAFLFSSVGIDVLRLREGDRGTGTWIGVATSVFLAFAFVGNLAARPYAAVYGGGALLLGMAVAFGTRSGAFETIIARIPRLTPPRHVQAGQDVPFNTLAQASALEREAAPGILVASRGATRKIFREACDRARSRGQERIYLAYVDEVPGLFYPQLAAPTPEGLTVLSVGCEVIRELGVMPVPVWALSHSAPVTVVEMAEELGCDTVVIGATQRTFLWHALRGRFIQELLRLLPAHIRLIVVG